MTTATNENRQEKIAGAIRTVLDMVCKRDGIDMDEDARSEVCMVAATDIIRESEQFTEPTDLPASTWPGKDDDRAGWRKAMADAPSPRAAG